MMEEGKKVVLVGARQARHCCLCYIKILKAFKNQ